MLLDNGEVAKRHSRGKTDVCETEKGKKVWFDVRRVPVAQSMNGSGMSAFEKPDCWRKDNSSWCMRGLSA